MTRSFIQHFATVLLLMVIVSCAAIPRFTSKKPLNYRDNTKEGGAVYFDKYSDLSKVLETEVGLASFYADDFHGKLTFTGEVYDMYGTTAAHPTYPMNTIIRVTNTSNDRQIKIRINDRMPQHPDRIIDLSLGSAQELDIVKEGTVEVKVEVLKWGE